MFSVYPISCLPSRGWAECFAFECSLLGQVCVLQVLTTKEHESLDKCCEMVAWGELGVELNRKSNKNINNYLLLS